MRKIFFDKIKEGRKPFLRNDKGRLYFLITEENDPHKIKYWVGVEISKKIDGYQINFYIDKRLSKTENRRGLLRHCLSDNALKSLPQAAQDKFKKFFEDIFDADES